MDELRGISDEIDDLLLKTLTAYAKHSIKGNRVAAKIIERGEWEGGGPLRQAQVIGAVAESRYAFYFLSGSLPQNIQTAWRTSLTIAEALLLDEGVWTRIDLSNGGDAPLELIAQNGIDLAGTAMKLIAEEWDDLSLPTQASLIGTYYDGRHIHHHGVSTDPVWMQWGAVLDQYEAALRSREAIRD